MVHERHAPADGRRDVLMKEYFKTELDTQQTNICAISLIAPVNVR